MSVQKKPSKTILYEIERHCNNYFNPRNDPNDPKRNYPPAFLELAVKIETFLNGEYEAKSSITSYSVGSESMSKDIQSNSWITLFSRELSLYRRIKTI